MATFEQAPLGLRLLGGFAARVGGRPVAEGAWRLRRAKSLIKLLALAPERRMHREQVAELLWPGREPTGNGLHQVLYTARRAVASDGGAGDRLVLRDDVVALVGDGIWVDVDSFERAAAAAREDGSVESYRVALKLYAGELLPEDRYEEWTATRRESLRETRLGLLVEVAEAHAGAADAAAAVEALQRAVVEDPLHEAAHRGLMRLFAGDGRPQQALAQYQQLRDALRRTLEADPDPATRRLYREILASQHEAQPEAEPAREPASLELPVRPAAEPSDDPRRAGAARSSMRRELPRQLTSFVGRERELTELDGLLGRARLLTLTGPGGCGKTRLALELASRRARDFAGGTPVVELAPIADAALVVEETAAAVGVKPRSERDPIELLGDQIGEAHVLLVLDNCEHLIDACARLADRLLRACPNLRLLATSREQLRIQGEVAWRVPPLSLPERAAGAEPPRLDQLERSEAIGLFRRRASDAVPGFALTPGNAAAVADICRRLDGMPLALELAAARITVLSPAQIADRLGDALALLRGGSRAGLTRQQTLRATLTWSHQLLTHAERVLYRRLGVFAGSFGVEAIDGICADDDGSCAGGAPLDLLAQLADKSLVQVEADAGHYRYRLLETVRQHARERLVEAGERERLEAAHRAWYLALAQAADRDLDPDVATAWPATRLEAEHDDLRAALASGIRDDPPAALRLARALWWFWMARGYFVEGARWFDDALAAAPAPTPERVQALWALGGIDVRRRGTIRTVRLGADALAIARRSGDPHAEARALERRGVLAMGGFDWPVADAALAEGLALAHELGDASVAVAIIQAQGVLAGCRGETRQARALLERSLTLLDEIPDERGPLFWALHISPIALPAGRGGAPRLFFEDTFCLFRAVRSRAGAAYVLLNIGEASRTDAAYGAARDAFERALERFRELGDDQGAGVALNALGNLARSTGDADAGSRRFEEALALRRAARDTREIATTFVGMGTLALYAGDEERGRGLLDEAAAIFERTEDGPGLQCIPLNLGAFELDRGDPRRACSLLERCAQLSRGRRIVPNLAWALAELGEAAIAIGELERARGALDEALTLLERSGDGRGARYARDLQARLSTSASVS
ncbi:MAG: transcriptional activator domain protein [Conexibacter sp.]|nr:transcriptional activator domain protein [Conexibacter sp.]